MTDAHVPIETLLAHADWVRALARKLVDDESTADDLVQETWLTAMQKPPRPGSQRGWLGTVLRNAWRQRARAESRRAHHEAAPEPRPPTESTATIVERADAHQRVVQAVMTLDEPYRSTVLLRFYDGLRPSEIAARTGVPVETVRTRTRRAVARLREELDAREGGDGRAWRATLVPLLTFDRGVSATGATVATATGVLAMSLGTKIAAGVAVVALIGGLVWWQAPDDAREPDDETADASSDPAEEAADGDPGRRRVEVSESTTPDERVAPSTSGNERVATVRERDVRVEHADGTPASRVLVLAFNGDDVLHRASTDDQGRVTLETPNVVAHVVVVADGYPVTSQRLADTGDTTVELPEGETIAGVVRVDGGAPGEELRLTMRPNRPIGRYGDVPDAVRRTLRDLDRDPEQLSAVVDRAGRFAFRGLPPVTSGGLSVPTGFEAVSRGTLNVESPADGVLIELQRMATIRGRVLDDDGNPSPRARAAVTFTDEQGIDVKAVRHAGNDGVFVVGLPVRRAQGVVVEFANRDGRGDQSMDLGTLEPGVRDLGEIRLASIATVSVRVRDPDGQPITGAVITPKYGTRSLSERTDDAGLTEFPLSERDTKMTVAALGYLPHRRVLREQTTDVVEVELQPATLLRVTPTGSADLPNGLAVRVRADGPVTVDTDGAEGAWEAAGAAGREARDDAEQPNQGWFLTADDGSAVIAGLVPDGELEVSYVDALGVEHGSERVVLRAGEPREVSLSITGPVVTLRGRVLDLAGEPIANARLRASGSDGRSLTLSETADAEGRFEIDGVAARTIELLVFAERHTMQKLEAVEVDPNETEFEIRLESAQTVRLRVLDADGNLVSNAIVSMRLPAKGDTGKLLSRLARRVGDGEYDLRDCPPRDVNVSVRVGGKSHPFTIDGKNPEATVRLPAE